MDANKYPDETGDRRRIQNSGVRIQKGDVSVAG